MIELKLRVPSEYCHECMYFAPCISGKTESYATLATTEVDISCDIPMFVAQKLGYKINCPEQMKKRASISKDVLTICNEIIDEERGIAHDIIKS